jgi:hypothetical protein
VGWQSACGARVQDARLSRTYALIYFDPSTQKYARGTIYNIREGGPFKFEWVLGDRLYERHKNKLAMLQMLEPYANSLAKILKGVGSVRRSKVHAGLLLYCLYNDDWRKES